MIKLKYSDITITFQDWYDAASWFYNAWDMGNPDIVRIVDSSMHCFVDFAAWVNDNYTAYDILSRCDNSNLYDDLFEKYLNDFADDLEDDVYDFCVLFTEEEDEDKPQPNPNVKYYKIIYSCGCGDSEEYIAAKDFVEAEEYAYEQAIEDYHSFEGLHGIRSLNEVAEEMFGDDEDEDFDIDNLTLDQIEDAQIEYEEEIQSSISYYVAEVSFEEYLENGGYIE